MPQGPGTYGKKRGRPRKVKSKKKKGGSGKKVKIHRYADALRALDKQKSKKKLKGMR